MALFDRVPSLKLLPRALRRGSKTTAAPSGPVPWGPVLSWGRPEDDPDYGVGFGGKATQQPGFSMMRAMDAGTTRRMNNFGQYLHALNIPVVYSALSLIAYNYAATPLRLLDDDDNEVDLAKVPELRRLLKRPNPRMNGFEFRESLAYDLFLTGNWFLVMDSLDGKGRPTELFRLPPDKVSQYQDPTGEITYTYEVILDNEKREIAFPSDQVGHLKFFNPANPLWGIGIVEAGEAVFSASRLQMELQRNYFGRGAILDGVITTEKYVSKEDYDRQLQEWRTLRYGSRNEFKTAMLWAGADYKPIQEPMGNIPLVDLAKMTRNQALQLIGVPPQMLGDFDQTTYRNGQEANSFFWSETMTPLLVRSEKVWNLVVERFGPYHVEHPSKEINDLVARSTAAQHLANTGAATINDIRVYAGLDPFDEDDPAGQAIVLPKGWSLIPEDYREKLELLPFRDERRTDAPEDLDEEAAEDDEEVGQDNADPNPAPGGTAPSTSVPVVPARRGAASTNTKRTARPPAPRAGAKAAPPPSVTERRRTPPTYNPMLLSAAARRAQERTQRAARLSTPSLEGGTGGKASAAVLATPRAPVGTGARTVESLATGIVRTTADLERAATIARFRELINVSPTGLHGWLSAREATTEPVGDQSQGTGAKSVGATRSGRRIIEILGKPDDALGVEDLRHMRKAIGYIERHLAERPKNDQALPGWAANLRDWGHDVGAGVVASSPTPTTNR